MLVRFSSILLLISALMACANVPPPLSGGHLQSPPPAPASVASIPPPVQWDSSLPEPQTPPQTDTYTVVVNDVPAAELLFALAQESGMNVDIHPHIEGNVTLHAIDQTMQQIVERLAAQVSLRYSMKGESLVVTPDTPYFQNYKINYANIARDTTHSVSLSTQIASTGTSLADNNQGNNSTTRVNTVSSHHLWESLILGVIAILGEAEALADAENSTDNALPVTPTVIPNPESGILTVLATQAQHQQIRRLIDNVQENSDRQVLIEATVVEVALSEEFRAGIDWRRVADGDGFDFDQSLIGGNFAGLPFFTGTYNNVDSAVGNISATVSLLEKFGDVKILSSPKVMVLNNQNAILKVVDTIVYFTLDIDEERNEAGTLLSRSFESEVHTVPVGFVMTVTPQISASGKITMNVRPTVSRVLEFVEDPAVSIASANAIASTPAGGVAPEPVVSAIPVVQVREFESMLRVNTGQTAILGGLMQDIRNRDRDGLPGASRLGTAGELLQFRNTRVSKTELVVFLRPTIIENPDIESELSAFKPYLTPPEPALQPQAAAPAP